MRGIAEYKGEPHLTSTQFREIIESIVGTGNHIANIGELLEPELAANNTVKIRSGVLIHHGDVVEVKRGTYDEVTYQNGTQAMKRIDLIVSRYTKNAGTGIEESQWVCIMGTPDETNPVTPDYTKGNMQNGDLVDDCPVFELHLDGINVTEVKKLLPVLPNINELNNKLMEQNILWQNAGMFMTATQTAALNEKISEQKNGIVLVFSCYENSSTQNYGWQTHFIPRSVVSLLGNGAGHEISLARGSNVGSKYLYIYDDKISGNAANGTSPNSRWVMRYVIGV